MKKIAFLPLLLCLLNGPLEGMGAQADFADFPLVQTNLFVLPEDSLLSDEQWVMAQNISIAGEARDDLFLLAGSESAWFAGTNTGIIRMTGSVGGSLWAICQKMEIEGPVEHHLRVLSQSLRVNSRLGGNLWAFTKDSVILDTNAIVQGSARIQGDYVYLRGTIDGNVVVTAAKVVLDGTVNGSVSVDAQDLQILSNTRIRGSMAYKTPGVLAPDRAAVIEGGLQRQEPASGKDLLLIHLMTTLLFLVGAILTGIFFLLFAPRLVVHSTLCMETYPWRALLIGFAALAIPPFVAIFLFVSWMGIPLSLVIAALWGTAAYLGRFVAALSVARLLTGNRRLNPIPAPSPRLMLLGLLLFYGSSFLPCPLAGAIWLWFTVTGLGGLIMACRGTPLPVASATASPTKPETGASQP